jgi:putative DNA primase/helicase
MSNVAPFASRPKLAAYSLTQLSSYRFTPRRALLCRGGEAVFREGHLGQVSAKRGVGKTWFMHTLALVAASGVSALGFSAPEPSRVLIVDGEMASEEIQQRLLELCRWLSMPLDVALTVIASDWQDDFLPRVDSPDGQAALEPFVSAADLIILDNRSCLFDSEGEKDAAAWAAAQNYLLSLRRRGKGVLLAHHANRQGDSRGHSKPEDIYNLMLKLARPEGYTTEQGARFVIDFEKTRGVHGSAVSSFTAALTGDGWRVDDLETETDQTARKLREYLSLAHQANERPTSANAAISKAGVQRNKGLTAWADMLKRRELIKHPDGGFYVP